MDLKKELRIMVKYILPKEEHDKDVIENYVDTLALINEEYVKQLRIGGVVSSSDLIVVELSDEEIKIITEKELNEWRKSAIEFDGFEGWIVRGRLVK